MTLPPDVEAEFAKAAADGWIAGGVSEERVAAAEEALGVKLPASYRAYLLRFGAALVRRFEADGLPPPLAPDATPLWGDVVVANERLHCDGHLPREYIYISSNGMDHYFYLDCGKRYMDGECPVIVLGPGRDSVQIAATFREFLVQSVRGTLIY